MVIERQAISCCFFTKNVYDAVFTPKDGLNCQSFTD